MPTAEINIAEPSLGADAAFEHPPAASQLAEFEVLHELGGGDRAELYLARERSLHRLVALKILRSCATLDQGRLERCLREARTASALSDAPIVPVFHVGKADGRTYLVDAYMEGGSLADVLRSRTLEPEEAAMLGARIAGALAAAHRRGLVHHAVKPSNVLFDGRGNAFLSDFGVGRLPGLGGLPAAVPRAGVAEYVAPELARSGKASGGSADLYALGVTLYEALAGRPPFSEEDPTETLGQHCFAPVPPLPDFVPASLSQAVLKCLAKNPSARFADAAELAEALGHAELAGRLVDLARPPTEPFVEEDPSLDEAEAAGQEPVGQQPIELVEVHEERPRRRPSRGRRPRRGPWPVAMVATLALVLSSAAFAWHQGILTSSAAPAPASRQQPLVDPTTGSPPVDAASASPGVSPSASVGGSAAPADLSGSTGRWQAPAGRAGSRPRSGAVPAPGAGPGQAAPPASGGQPASGSEGGASDASDGADGPSWSWVGWWHGWGHRPHPSPTPRPTPAPPTPAPPAPKPSGSGGGGQTDPGPRPGGDHPTSGSPSRGRPDAGSGSGTGGDARSWSGSGSQFDRGSTGQPSGGGERGSTPRGR